MQKLIKGLILSIFTLFLFVGSTHAATSVRLQKPDANTNKTNLSLTFVALDTENQTVTVKCFKSFEGGSFSQFGGDIVTSAGGNTDTCNATLDQGNGTYAFKVTADGSSSSTSETWSITFNNSTPGTPQYIGKDKISACVNRIKFKTADDGGKTVKVEIYRADKTTFDANSGSRLGTVTVGSNEYREYDDTLVSCDTTFYYAIRAFDAYGNGSGVVGDTNTVTTVINPTTTEQQTQGAIALGNGSGSVLGAGTDGSGATKDVLGESSESAQQNDQDKMERKTTTSAAQGLTDWVLNHKTTSLFVLLIVGALAYYLYRRAKK